MTKGNIRLYTTESEYLLEKDSFELPNVSFVEDSKIVFYNAKTRNPWATMANGVYAVGADGSPVMAEGADESCIGVALIVNDAPVPQRIMIAKEDATDGTNNTFYWGYNLMNIDISKIVDKTFIGGGVTGTGSSGYLPGKYEGTISDNYTTWTSGAISDFNGKANTEAIISAYNEYGVEMDNRDMCKVLQDLNSTDEVDWYVPSCGQLALIFINRININDILSRIGGTPFASYERSFYWPSSEYATYGAWRLLFEDGRVDFDSKVSLWLTRFVRDLI